MALVSIISFSLPLLPLTVKRGLLMSARIRICSGLYEVVAAGLQLSPRSPTRHPVVKKISFVVLGVMATKGTYAPFISTLLSLLPTFSDNNITGYVYATLAETGAVFIKTNSDDVASVNATLAPIYDLAQQSEGELVALSKSGVAPSIYSLFLGGLGVSQEGVASILGSRLFPRSVFEDKDKVDSMSQIFRNSGIMTILCLVGGGKVNEPTPDVMGVNPSWRNALAHVVVADSWSYNSTISERNAVHNKITQLTQRLGEFAGPDMGAYINE